MNENETLSTDLFIDYTDSINNINNTNIEINETLKSINDNLQFLREYFEITEEEQRIIDDNLKKDSEALTKQKEKDLEIFISSLEESTLSDIHNELKLLNDKTLENNTVVNDSSNFFFFAFILLLGLLVGSYVIKFIKSIFDSFYNFY